MGFKSIILNSKRSSNQNTDNPTYYFNKSFYVNKFKIVEAEIPLTFLSIDATNNVLNFKEQATDGTTRSITITAGDYTSTTLCAEIKSKMDAAGTQAYTVSYSLSTYKITISASANFKVLGSSTCSWIGENDVDGVYATSFTFPNVLNLQGPNSVYITASELSNNSVHLHGNEYINILAKIPLAGNKGSIVYYNDKRPYGWYESNSNLSSLTLSLVDCDTLKRVSLNGSPWSCTLSFSDDPKEALF